MDPEKPSKQRIREEILSEFIEQLDDANHRRIIAAYSDDSPIKSMEQELFAILQEIISSEDK